MVAATLALAGFFVSFYLWLWKLGVGGSPACGPGGGCECVQTSPWAMIFGLPVGLFGVVGYLVLVTVSLIGLQPGWAQRREPTLALVALSGAAVLFTAYLTYLEAAVIHAWGTRGQGALVWPPSHAPMPLCRCPVMPPALRTWSSTAPPPPGPPAW